MKKYNRFCILSFLLIVGMLIAFSFGYGIREEQEKEKALGEAATVGGILNTASYTIKLSDTKLVVISDGETIETFEVDPRSMAPDVREILSLGISVNTVEEIHNLLEDITS